MKTAFVSAVVAAVFAHAGSAHAGKLLPVPGPGGCIKSINLVKQWNADSGDANTGLGSFSAGVGAGASLTGDCHEVAASISGQLRGKVFGVTAPPPLEVALTASTDEDHHSALTFDIKALGFTVKSYEIADSDQAISDGGTFVQMLPVWEDSPSSSGSWGIPGTNVSLGYTVSSDVVGNFLGLYSYQAQPDLLKALFWGQVDASARLTATGSYTNTSSGAAVRSASLSGTADIILIKGEIRAFGKFKPTFKLENAPPNTMALINPPKFYNAWEVTGRAAYDLVEGIKGTLTANVAASVRVPFIEEIQYVDQSFSFNVLSLGGLSESLKAGKEWEQVRTYYKPFQ